MGLHLAFLSLQFPGSSDLAIPLSVVVVSAVSLLLHASFSCFTCSRNDSDPPAGRISTLGGPGIFGCYLVRLIACLALTGLTIVSLSKGKNELGNHIALATIFLYSTILALVSISADRRWSQNSVRHLNTVLCVTLAVYAYRDIYPLGTYVLTPQDKDEGSLLWAKISLLILAGVIIPLSVPREYIPVDRKNPKLPTPEQTCSLLSMLVYGFIDSVIVKSYYSQNFLYNDLSPLSDYDYVNHLTKRSIRYFDPTVVVKRRNAFFGIIQTFSKEIALATVLVMLQAILNFTTPIGVENLLEYLETNGENAFFKPFVWIAGIFVGRMLQTMSFESYLYISTQLVVHTQAILTETILEHALRIRVKAETSDSELVGPSPSTSGTITPAPDSGTTNFESSIFASEDDDRQTLHSATLPSKGSTVHAGSSNISRNSSSVNLRKVDENVNISVPQTPLASNPVKSKPKGYNSLGKVNNLVTGDLQNICDGREAIRLLVELPIQLTLCVIFLYRVLGWSALVGLTMMVVLFPVPGLFTKMIRTRQEMRMTKTDARIQMVTETMNVMRMVKFFGWETLMSSRIKDVRSEELTYIRKLRLLELATGMSSYVIRLLSILLVYGTYTVVMKQELSASKVFSSLVVFKMFGGLTHSVVDFLTQSVKAKVSLDRVTEFLYETELLDAFICNDFSLAITPTQEIGFRNATFSWSNDYFESSVPSMKRCFSLQIDGELIFMKNTINLIIGSTGSGKTSMLMALLSEMHFIPSGPDSWYSLPRDRGVAYVAQESWVLNATIKENIVFGSDYDEERYKKVLYQCALVQDLELLEAGDETEVGERGITISGGQKARVTLARAIYSKAEIILLDDVLAALDVHTAKWIVNKCFKGDLIQDRTVLMVTNNVALVSIARFVVSIKNGRILSRETISETLSHGFRATWDQAESSTIKDIEADENDVEKFVDGKLIMKEEVQVGNVSWPALRLLFKALGGQHVVLFFVSFICCFAVSELSEIGQTWYLGRWSSAYEGRNPGEVEVVYYLSGYALIMALNSVAFCCGFVIYLFGVIRASSSIHDQLVQSVLGATLRWLDTTPASRVIMRCTEDMRDIDGTLTNQLSTLTRITIILATQFSFIIYYSPAFLVPGLLISLAGAFLGYVYVKAQLPIRRLQSNAKAPVLAHLGTVMRGLVSVRAYGVQQRFIEESFSRINHYSRPARIFYDLNRWINVRLDLLGNIFSASLAVYLVYYRGQTASNTGFSLNMAVLFTSSILAYISVINEFQLKTNSLERINAYIEIEQEPKPTRERVPPAYWPSSGDLRVENLNARYSLNGPKVLHDISFHVKSGERIGVVGRTGSGKSSLMLSLLRCIYTDGETYLDGIPTSSINLNDLRTKITIIPQMPELLSGTLRRSLDPFDQYDDAMLYGALCSAGLYAAQNEECNRVGLDTVIASGGSNLSVGQRQILALARAMVRESKLLILDEVLMTATSAIDYKTDGVIQSSLRQGLKGGISVITIAHRLQTIMDCDKIMVLDAGRMVEYDSPKELLKKRGGHFEALVDESVDKEHLLRMVEGVVGDA